MSTSTSTLINTFVQRRLFMDGEIIYPDKDFVLQFDGPFTGLAIYGAMKRIALMEAALILLDTDKARIMREAVKKGFRITLVRTEVPVLHLWDAMAFDVDGLTELNGEELRVADIFLDALHAKMVAHAKQIFNECLDIRSSGLDDVDYSDERARTQAVDRIIKEFRKYAGAA